MEITLTKDNFKEVVLEADKPVLVDFWAAWCGPCRMVAPAVEAVATKTAGKAVVAKLNIDDEPELAAQFRVMSIPTLMVFNNGEVSAKTVGVQSEEQIMTLLGL